MMHWTIVAIMLVSIVVVRVARTIAGNENADSIVIVVMMMGNEQVRQQKDAGKPREG
jgi:hypothetical protein